MLAAQPDLPADSQYLLLNYEVSAGGEVLDTTSWRVEFIDAAGQIYTPASAALTHTDDAAAGNSVAVSFGGLHRTRYAAKRAVGDYRHSRYGMSFALSFANAPLDLRYDGVDVRLVSVTYLDGQITTHLRTYNGRSETLPFTQDDIWLALGYAPEPPGPRNPAEGLTPFDLLPEQAVDLRLVWYWAANRLQVWAWVSIALPFNCPGRSRTYLRFETPTACYFKRGRSCYF